MRAHFTLRHLTGNVRQERQCFVSCLSITSCYDELFTAVLQPHGTPLQVKKERFVNPFCSKQTEATDESSTHLHAQQITHQQPTTHPLSTSILSKQIVPENSLLAPFATNNTRRGCVRPLLLSHQCRKQPEPNIRCVDYELPRTPCGSRSSCLLNVTFDGIAMRCPMTRVPARDKIR